MRRSCEKNPIYRIMTYISYGVMYLRIRSKIHILTQKDNYVFFLSNIEV